MSILLFEDVDPADGCPCEECARARLAASVERGRGGAEPVSAAARAVVVAATVGTALCAGAGAAAASSAERPGAAAEQLARDDILDRAREWAHTPVPYSMSARWRDGYRQDCSGYVSMAWGLGGNAWTGSLPEYAVPIDRDELRPGDILLYQNPGDPYAGSHVVIFGGWTDASRTHYTAYEQTRPHTRVRVTPYPYWNHRSHWVAYRYKYLTGRPGRDGDGLAEPTAWRRADGYAGARYTTGPGHKAGRDRAVPPYPGRGRFRPGRSGEEVLRLGRRLVDKGYGEHYRSGPGWTWTEADRRNVEAFQRAQGWSARDADGYPGPETWRRLFS